MSETESLSSSAGCMPLLEQMPLSTVGRVGAMRRQNSKESGVDMPCIDKEMPCIEPEFPVLDPQISISPE